MRLASITNLWHEFPGNCSPATNLSNRSGTASFPAAMAIAVLVYAGAPAARAADCVWNDATANWTTSGDWSNCNGTFPNNGDNANIPVGNPTLTTSVTLGSVTITSAGAWTLIGASAVAMLTGPLTNSGDFELHGTPSLGGGPSVTTASGVNFTNGGPLNIDTGFPNANGEGGSSLTLGGVLTNNTGTTINVGNPFLSATSTLAAAGLANAGTINLRGSGAHQAVLNVTSGSAANTGDLEVHENVALTTASGVNLTNSGTFNVDTGFPNSNGEGGSNVTVGGTLSNTTTLSIGNPFLSAPTTVAAAGLGNLGNINLTGSATNLATLNFTGAAAPTTVSTAVRLSGASLLEFASGSFTSIAGTGVLSLTGAGARVADASDTAHSGALSLLNSNTGDFELHGTPSLGGGPSVTTASGVNFTNGGPLNIDTGFPNANGEGGSSLTLGGVLTNNTGTTINVGNPFLSATSTLAAAGLANAGTINLRGSGAHQAVLNVTSGSAANTGDLEVHENVALTTASGVNLTNSGTFNVDTGFPNSNGEGGSNVTVGGTLSNTTTLSIGNPFLSAPTTVAAAGLGSLGNINLTGSATNLATLNFTGAAAPTTVSTAVRLSGASLLEFASGSFTSIAGTGVLSLTGAGARVADASDTAHSGALSLLNSNTGDFELHGTPSLGGGPSVTTASGVNFTNGGPLNIDTGFPNANGEGGSSLTLGGVLTNNTGTTINVGNPFLSATSTLAAAGLANAGTINLRGSGAHQAVLNVTSGSAANTGDLEVHENVALTTASGVNLTNSGTFNVDTGFPNSNGEGGSNVTVGGTLSNTTTLSIGNPFLSAPTTVAAAGLGSLGNINLTGSATNLATLNFTGAAAPTTVSTAVRLSGASLLEFASGSFTSIAGTGVLSLTGAGAGGRCLRHRAQRRAEPAEQQHRRFRAARHPAAGWRSLGHHRFGG